MPRGACKWPQRHGEVQAVTNGTHGGFENILYIVRIEHEKCKVTPTYRNLCSEKKVSGGAVFDTLSRCILKFL